MIAPSLNTLLADKLPTEIDHLDWMKTRVGEYPFDIYGSFVVDATARLRARDPDAVAL